MSKGKIKAIKYNVRMNIKDMNRYQVYHDCLQTSDMVIRHAETTNLPYGQFRKEQRCRKGISKSMD